MQRWYIFLLIIILAAMFTACSFGDSQAIASTEATILPNDRDTCPVTTTCGATIHPTTAIPTRRPISQSILARV